jgi:hypothetical protein
LSVGGGGVLLLLDVEHTLLLLNVGRDQVVKKEEGFSISGYKYVMIKI